MSAKVELEAFVDDKHPYPQYIQHHISLSETSVKQFANEGHQLVADGYPEDIIRKDHLSSSAKVLNGHAETNLKTGAHSDDMPGGT